MVCPLSPSQLPLPSHVPPGLGLRRNSQSPLHCLWCLNSLRCPWRYLWSCPQSLSYSHSRPFTGTKEGGPQCGEARLGPQLTVTSTGQWHWSCRPTGSQISIAWCHLITLAGWLPGSSTCSWVSMGICVCTYVWGGQTGQRLL